MLELIDIHKYFLYSGHVLKVLKGIDLTISSGDTVAVTGVSGAGKSTLLHIMGTLDPPTQGKVKFEGRPVDEMNESEICELRNREIGFVFQFHHLLPELNAVENVMMPLMIRGKPQKMAKIRSMEVLEMVGLKDRANHRTGELSGGEQQRVAIARAVVAGPRILIADEPTGNLDKNTGQEIIELLLRLNRENNLAIVVATHNRTLASMMSRELELIDGRFQIKKEP